MRKVVFSFLALLFLSCSSVTKTPYRIAIDPSFYPLDLMGKEANVFAFCNELLQLVSKKEHLPLIRINASWDNLLDGLQKDEFDAVISPLPPYNFNLAKYDFSSMCLKTGYVLVIREDDKVKTLKKLKDREVAVQMNSEAERILDDFPDVIVRFYDNPAQALEQLEKRQFDGVVMDSIPAASFIYDRYADVLKIGTEPLNDAGLRIVALKNTHNELLEHINRGIERLKSDGTYDTLLKKWKLY